MFQRGGNRARFMEIPLEAIRPGDTQARLTFNPEELAGLAASIRQVGILQPVVVRREGKGYALVAGERRWRAAKMAGLKTIPSLVQDNEGAEAALAGLIENIQRTDLTPLEEAEGLRHLLSLTGITQEALARRLGRSQSAISNKLRLLKLDERVKTLARLHPDRLTERHLRALLQVKDGAGQWRTAEQVVRASWTVQELEGQIHRLETPPKQRKKKGWRRGIVRDVRIVLNTFRRSVATLVESGLAAEMVEEDRGDAITITIRIPKRRTKERA